MKMWWRKDNLCGMYSIYRHYVVCVSYVHYELHIHCYHCCHYYDNTMSMYIHRHQHYVQYVDFCHYHICSVFAGYDNITTHIFRTHMMFFRRLFYHYCFEISWVNTLQGTNISPKNGILKMIFQTSRSVGYLSSLGGFPPSPTRSFSGFCGLDDENFSVAMTKRWLMYTQCIPLTGWWIDIYICNVYQYKYFLVYISGIQTMSGISIDNCWYRRWWHTTSFFAKFTPSQEMFFGWIEVHQINLHPGHNVPGI